MPTTTKRVSRKPPERCGQGRPVAAENDVGQERLLVPGDKLLRRLPPARVADCDVHGHARKQSERGAGYRAGRPIFTRNFWQLAASVSMSVRQT